MLEAIDIFSNYCIYSVYYDATDPAAVNRADKVYAYVSVYASCCCRNWLHLCMPNDGLRQHTKNLRSRYFCAVTMCLMCSYLKYGRRHVYMSEWRRRRAHGTRNECRVITLRPLRELHQTYWARNRLCMRRKTYVARPRSR